MKSNATETIPLRDQPLERESVSSSTRSEAVDFLKGFFVAGMVVFHAINYFAYQLNGYLLYIKFVSGGFVVISGYTITTFYAVKWNVDPKAVSRRLLARGFRLIALFTIINLSISLLGVQNHNGVRFGVSQFFDNVYEIFFLGQGRLVAFEILLPIGYTLLVAPAFLYARQYRIAVIVLSVLAFVASCSTRWSLGNPNLFLLGVVGMLIGLQVPPEKLGSKKTLPLSAILLSLAILSLPILHLWLLGFLVYTVIVSKFAADVCVTWQQFASVKAVLLQYGRYSLFCYLVHIAFLQVLFRTFWRLRDSDMFSLSVIVVGTWLLLTLLVFAVERLRRLSKNFDAFFRFVFA